MGHDVAVDADFIGLSAVRIELMHCLACVSVKVRLVSFTTVPICRKCPLWIVVQALNRLLFRYESDAITQEGS
jgi:hypothetical protein